MGCTEKAGVTCERSHNSNEGAPVSWVVKDSRESQQTGTVAQDVRVVHFWTVSFCQ